MTNRIYVACLASYNNGVLHGQWIEASADADEMKEEVNAMLRASKFPNVTVEIECPECNGFGKTIPQTALSEQSACWRCKGHARISVPSAEEFAIHDHEGQWMDGLKEYSGLVEVAYRMQIADAIETEMRCDEDEAAELFSAYQDHYGVEYTKGDEPSDVADRIRDAYLGEFQDRGDWAAGYFEETGALENVPQILQCYIDWDSVARDCEINGDVSFTSGGRGVRAFRWE